MSIYQDTKLRQPRDKAFGAYLIARLKLLENEIICINEDVQDIQAIYQEIENAATQNLITVIKKLTSPLQQQLALNL